MAAEADRRDLERLAAGDGEALGGLVARHQDRLLRLCERMLGSSEEARDATQEVFLKVFRKAASYRPRGQVYTWLYRIAVNHCLNRLRRRRLVAWLGFGGAEEEGRELEVPHPAADPEAELATRRRWRSTRRAIAALPPGQRAVLLLVRFEGLSYRQAAAALGITVGAVESRLFRAMRRLEARSGEAATAPPRTAAQESVAPGFSRKE